MCERQSLYTRHLTEFKGVKIVSDRLKHLLLIDGSFLVAVSEASILAAAGDVFVLELLDRGGLLKRAGDEDKVNFLECTTTGFGAVEVDYSHVSKVLVVLGSTCSGTFHTVRNGNEVEHEEPDPRPPADAWVRNGNWSREDGQEGHEPL